MANRPKGKLMALLAIFAAIGIVTATGAFTSVQAERTVDVATTGDASANLAIESINSTSDNYVIDDGDTIALDFTSVNLRAKTDFGALLAITNNMQSPASDVFVTIATHPKHLSDSSDFGTFVNDGDRVLRFEGNGSTNIMGGDAEANQSLTISPGNTEYVHVSIDTLGDGTTAQELVSGEIFVIYASQNDPAS